jgi:hypothetical protein
MEQALQNKLKASAAERVINGSLILAGAAATAVIGYFNPVTAGFFPACPLYTTTGIFCPGCGLTRGFHALIHGDVLAAFHFNALWPFYAFLFSYVLLSAMLVVIRGRGLGYRFFQPWMLYGFMALSLIFAVLRNIPGYPFSLLAPS